MFAHPPRPRFVVRRAAAALGGLLALAAAGCAPQPPSGSSAVVDEAADDPPGEHVEWAFRPLAEPPGHRLELAGFAAADLAAIARLDPGQLTAVLRVQVVGGLDDLPPVAGAWSVAGEVVAFTPRFPFEPGLRYRASLDAGALRGGASGPPLDKLADFALPEVRPVPSTVVSAIYPTADRLPENQLKFYLHFSAPMSRGQAYRHIRLFDETTGSEVDAPFLELGEELWDGALQRFTLLCDPGRVKRGLKPREELGGVLHEGHRYALVIDAAWPDARQTPLAQSARKEFAVGPPDDVPVDPQRWQLEAPAAGGTGSLVVRLGEPLDHAQLLRVVRVVSASGDLLQGEIAVDEHETRWRFTPAAPWRPGAYQIVADTTLEDLAGNSIGRPFEVDVFDTVDRGPTMERAARSFEIR